MSCSKLPFFVVVLLALVGEARLQGQEARDDLHPLLVPNDRRTCVLADSKQPFLYSAVEGPNDSANRNWRVQWSLTFGSRTISRGSAKPFIPADSDVPMYLVEIPMPPLREGVVMSVSLEMTWTDGEEKYEHSRPLHVFSPNTFAEQREFLHDANISLFDPIGKTGKLLEESKIPYTSRPSLASVNSVSEGIVIVGEGVSFSEQRMLAESLLLAASRGVSVLCLAPAEGDFCLKAELDGETRRPNRMDLQRGGVVRRFDKRFDDLVTLSNLSLVSRRNEIVLKTGSTTDEWSWLQLEFPAQPPGKPPGKLILCGMGIMSHWEASPVPRYLVSHLLHELANSNSSSEEPYNEKHAQ